MRALSLIVVVLCAACGGGSEDQSSSTSSSGSGGGATSASATSSGTGDWIAYASPGPAVAVNLAHGPPFDTVKVDGAGPQEYVSGYLQASEGRARFFAIVNGELRVFDANAPAWKKIATPAPISLVEWAPHTQRMVVGSSSAFEFIDFEASPDGVTHMVTGNPSGAEWSPQGDWLATSHGMGILSYTLRASDAAHSDIELVDSTYHTWDASRTGLAYTIHHVGDSMGETFLLRPNASATPVDLGALDADRLYFSGDGHTLVMNGVSSWQVGDPSSGSPLPLVSVLDSFPPGDAGGFSPASNWLASFSVPTGNLTIVRRTGPTAFDSSYTALGGIRLYAFSPDDQILVLADTTSLSIAAASDAFTVRTPVMSASYPDRIGFSPKGTWFAFVAGGVFVVRAGKTTALPVLAPDAGVNWDYEWLDDGRMVVTNSTDTMATLSLITLHDGAAPDVTEIASGMGLTLLRWP